MKRMNYFAQNTSDRKHVDGTYDEESECWCEPITFYVSDATGNRAQMHRATDGSLPPAGLLAESRRWCDMPDADKPEDFL